MKPMMELANNGPLAERAYAVIRRAILRCELAPGERVTESRLADRYEFGRAAVRAALIRLVHEQLLQVTPRHGYSVAPITFKHVHDLFGVRLIVEPAAARLAAGRADDRLVAQLEGLNLACAHIQGNDDISALREANKAFHASVARASGNDRLAEVSSVAMDELDRVLYLPQLANVWDRIDATFVEHQRIVDAIRARDAEAAEQAAAEHVLPNKQFVMDVLTSSPQVRSINLIGV